jgi:hypothetical protein
MVRNARPSSFDRSDLFGRLQFSRKFLRGHRELEVPTLALSQDHNVDGNNDLEGMDPYGHSVMRKRKLLDDLRCSSYRLPQAVPAHHHSGQPTEFGLLFRHTRQFAENSRSARNPIAKDPHRPRRAAAFQVFSVSWRHQLKNDPETTSSRSRRGR